MEPTWYTESDKKTGRERRFSAWTVPILEMKTDNGTEFSNDLLVVKSKHETLFEEALEEMENEYHRIRTIEV